jgi:hypothetical protein
MWRRQQQAAEYQERLAEALGSLELEIEEIPTAVPVGTPAE